MTWKHVSGLLIAGLILFGCGLSQHCSSPDTFHTVAQLANTIASAVMGNALGREASK